jgi:hypothetical protein
MDFCVVSKKMNKLLCACNDCPTQLDSKADSEILSLYKLHHYKIYKRSCHSYLDCDFVSKPTQNENLQYQAEDATKQQQKQAWHNFRINASNY